MATREIAPLASNFAQSDLGVVFLEQFHAALVGLLGSCVGGVGFGAALSEARRRPG
jgi:hypothetical protein